MERAFPQVEIDRPLDDPGPGTNNTLVYIGSRLALWHQCSRPVEMKAKVRDLIENGETSDFSAAK